MPPPRVGFRVRRREVFSLTRNFGQWYEHETEEDFVPRLAIAVKYFCDVTSRKVLARHEVLTE